MKDEELTLVFAGGTGRDFPDKRCDGEMRPVVKLEESIITLLLQAAG